MIDSYAKNDSDPMPESKGRLQQEMRIDIISDLAGLACYSDSWNQLAFDAPQKIPTLSYAWVSSYLETLLLPKETWRCILAIEGDRLIGVLPIIMTPFSFMGLKRYRVRSPHNKHSFSVDFLAARGRERDVFPRLLNSMFLVDPNIYEFTLNRLPENSPTLSTLASAHQGTIIVSEYDGCGSYLKIDGSFEEYRKSLGYNFARNLTKSRNKLAKLADVKAVFLTGPEATERELERFMKIESSGWKARAGTAIQLSPSLGSFYMTLTSRLSKLGWLEWHFLEAEGRAIAGQLGIRIGRTLLILKIGYDEEFSYCSPGNMLFEKVVERAYREKDTDEINCITDMPWHNNWAMLKRSHYNLWIYPRHPLPWAFGAMKIRAKIGLRRMPGVFPAYHRLRNLVKGKKQGK